MNDTFKSWLLVTIQAVLLALLIFLTDAQRSPYAAVGVVLQGIGWIILLLSFYDLRKSLTALPLPKDNGQLQIHGLYRFVRHPMYVGVLTLSLGICVASDSIAKYVLLLALFALFLYKSHYEEQLLLAKYPGYKKYMNQTGKFFPKLRHL